LKGIDLASACDAEKGIKAREEDDKQVFLAAAILLAAAVGQRHEPVDEKQISLAVDNAHRLYIEVKSRHVGKL